MLGKERFLKSIPQSNKEGSFNERPFFILNTSDDSVVIYNLTESFFLNMPVEMIVKIFVA